MPEPHVDFGVYSEVDSGTDPWSVLVGRTAQAASLYPGPMTKGAQSFPRRSRLLKPAEFKNVFDRAVVSSDQLFRVFARSTTSSQFRLGMAVSRKVDRRAVIRNRIKRVIRESFRSIYPVGAPDIGQGRDFVVLASPPAARATGNQLRTSLANHWQAIDRKMNQHSGGPESKRNRPEEKI